MKADELYRKGTGPLLRWMRTPTEPPEAPAGSHDSVLVMRASPKFLKYRMVLLAIASTLASLFGTGFVIGALVSGEKELLVLGAVLLVFDLFGTAIAWIVIKIDYELRYYVLTDRSLRVRSGALVVREQTLTFANVQNIDLGQGPIQRWLGIADLHVATAGGGGTQGKEGKHNSHEAVIAGVENAREIREQIRARLDALGDSGLGDPDDERAHASSRVADLTGAATSAALREVLVEARALHAAAEARA